MADQIYKVRDPQGNVREIKGPAGATDEQVIQQAQALFAATPVKQDITPSFAQSVKEEAKGMGDLSKFAIGVHGALNDAAMRLKQMLGRDLTPEETQGVVAHRALREDSNAALGGNIAGSVAMTASPGMAAERGVAAALGNVVPRMIAQPAAAAGVGAGIAAATTPLLGNETVAGSAASGAIGGVAGNVAARGLARVAQPITRTPDVQKLVEAGVIPTPGRAMGGIASQIEQSLESIPLVGSIIKNGNLRAVEELNRAAVNASLPNGARVAVVGRRAIDEAQNVFSDAYSKALTGKKVPISASDLDSAVQNIRADPDVFLSDSAEKNLTKILQQVQNKIPASGEMSGEVAKKLDSYLGGTAARYNKSLTAEDREFASAVLGLQKEFRSALSAVVPELKGIDTQYASFLRVQRAAGATGSKAGVFSPEALQNAVRNMDGGRKARFARGDAVMQDLSDPAVNVLGRTVADSGTPTRLMASGALLGAGNAADALLGSPGYLTALGLSPLLYSRTGARYMIGDLIPGQGAASSGLQALSPLFSQIGRAANSR